MLTPVVKKAQRQINSGVYDVVWNGTVDDYCLELYSMLDELAPRNLSIGHYIIGFGTLLQRSIINQC